jgi:hypothetical protein
MILLNKVSKVLGFIALISSTAALATQGAPSERAKAVFDFWTSERAAKAKPRDFVVDERGLGYLRNPNGTLQPYGHSVAAMAKKLEPRKGKPPGVGGGNGGGGDSGDGDTSTNLKTVRNAEWNKGGFVQNAAGRILFQMGEDYFVCSGTVANDGTSGRSIILTAAHCAYDDIAKQFATNVLFIPNQDATSGTGTDFDCSNDLYGCWAPSHGAVDVDWTTGVFPNNIPWDFAYYVIPDSGSHSGAGNEAALDSAVIPMDMSFTPATQDQYTHGLGYSYSEDPNFMYCAEKVGLEGSYGDLWLGSCRLSGGSSGGPWTQSTISDLDVGPLISVNSFGYRNRAGMGGPHLSGNNAGCLFDRTKSSDHASGGVIGC